MTLEEARAEIEGQFYTHPTVGNHSLAPTGEPYVEIVSGGEKAEGERTPVLCSSPEVAIRLWLQAAAKYAKRKNSLGALLYWRIMPEMDERFFLQVGHHGLIQFDQRVSKNFTNPYYVVYSRLLISDKPQIQSATLLSPCSA